MDITHDIINVHYYFDFQQKYCRMYLRVATSVKFTAPTAFKITVADAPHAALLERIKCSQILVVSAGRRGNQLECTWWRSLQGIYQLGSLKWRHSNFKENATFGAICSRCPAELNVAQPRWRHWNYYVSKGCLRRKVQGFLKQKLVSGTFQNYFYLPSIWQKPQ